jgi:hypothetical protein
MRNSGLEGAHVVRETAERLKFVLDRNAQVSSCAKADDQPRRAARDPHSCPWKEGTCQIGAGRNQWCRESRDISSQGS